MFSAAARESPDPVRKSRLGLLQIQPAFSHQTEGKTQRRHMIGGSTATNQSEKNRVGKNQVTAAYVTMAIEEEDYKRRR